MRTEVSGLFFLGRWRRIREAPPCGIKDVRSMSKIRAKAVERLVDVGHGRRFMAQDQRDDTRMDPSLL